MSSSSRSAPLPGLCAAKTPISASIVSPTRARRLCRASWPGSCGEEVALTRPPNRSGRAGSFVGPLDRCPRRVPPLLRAAAGTAHVVFPELSLEGVGPLPPHSECRLALLLDVVDVFPLVTERRHQQAAQTARLHVAPRDRDDSYTLLQDRRARGLTRHQDYPRRARWLRARPSVPGRHHDLR